MLPVKIRGDIILFMNNIIDDNDAVINFFEGQMHKALTFITHFDVQANILIGINTAMIGISLVSINSGYFVVSMSALAFFSTLSLIGSLYTVHPPKFLRKDNQAESLFYNKKINSFATPVDYAQALTGILSNREELVLNYSTEIYNMYKYSYRPKRNLFKLSRNLLMVGILLWLIIFLVL